MEGQGGSLPGGAMVLGKFQCRGVLLVCMIVRQGLLTDYFLTSSRQNLKTFHLGFTSELLANKLADFPAK